MLKPGGRIAYYNIFVAENLPPESRRKVAGSGWQEAYTPARQRGLLRSAGFTNIRENDVTAEYLRIARALYDANMRRARSLRKSLGAKQFDERRQRSERTIASIEAGDIRRSFFVAERPPRRR